MKAIDDEKVVQIPINPRGRGGVMKKAEAIQGSVRKWECLCGSQFKIINAVFKCTLCEYTFFDDDDIICKLCDLAMVECCIEDGSTWSKIQDVIDDMPILDQYLYLSDHPELCDLFEKMLEMVSSLEDQ